MRMVGGAQRAAREVAVELGELVAIDARVELAQRRVVLGAAALPRPQQQQHRGGDEAHRGEDEGTHQISPESSAAALALSVSDSGASTAAPRRRTTQPNAPMPIAMNNSGEPHSS